MVINLRGPGGAGKSTLVRQLLERHGPIVPLAFRRHRDGRPGSRQYEGVRAGRLHAVGDYRPACGGAEGMDMNEIERLVRAYASEGDVIFEGLLVSSMTTRWLRLALELEDFTFAFLVPPVEVCVQRWVARNAARPKPLTRDMDQLRENIFQKWRVQEKHRREFAAAGVRCVWLPWEDPLPALAALVRRTASREREEQALKV